MDDPMVSRSLILLSAIKSIIRAVALSLKAPHKGRTSTFILHGMQLVVERFEEGLEIRIRVPESLTLRLYAVAKEGDYLLASLLEKDGV